MYTILKLYQRKLPLGNNNFLSIKWHIDSCQALAATTTSTTTNANLTPNNTSGGVTTSPPPPPLQWRPTPELKQNYVNAYLKLSKIRLTSLVVVTTMAGYAMAPSPFCLTSFLLTAVGTGLLSSAANAVNQYHEVPFDAQMARTKNRILVCGKLTPLHCMTFAAVTSLTGVTLLSQVNNLTAVLGVANLLLYTSVYTPLKRVSILNTWIGSVVGAIPPLMGWAGCAGNLGGGAWLLAAILYSWQFPHFNALSWNLRADYSRAGYRMMAVTTPSLCRRVALRHTVILQLLTMTAPWIDTSLTGWWFVAVATPLNLRFVHLAYQFYRDASSATSRRLFRFSLLHLPALLALLFLCKARSSPDESNTKCVFLDNVANN